MAVSLFHSLHQLLWPYGTACLICFCLFLTNEITDDVFFFLFTVSREMNWQAYDFLKGRKYIKLISILHCQSQDIYLSIYWSFVFFPKFIPIKTDTLYVPKALYIRLSNPSEISLIVLVLLCIVFIIFQ